MGAIRFILGGVQDIILRPVVGSKILSSPRVKLVASDRYATIIGSDILYMNYSRGRSYLVFHHRGEHCNGRDRKTLSLNNKNSTGNKENLVPGFFKDLMLSGEQFMVQRKSTNSMSIIAGYHWFTDWGRDTMIAMRGLTIATGKKNCPNPFCILSLKVWIRGWSRTAFQITPKTRFIITLWTLHFGFL